MTDISNLYEISQGKSNFVPISLPKQVANYTANYSNDCSTLTKQDVLEALCKGVSIRRYAQVVISERREVIAKDKKMVDQASQSDQLLPVKLIKIERTGNALAEMPQSPFAQLLYAASKDKGEKEKTGGIESKIISLFSRLTSLVSRARVSIYG